MRSGCWALVRTLILYDLTNLFYTGRKKGVLLAYGRSKEKRSDCPLVTLALTLDASGFVRGAAVLAGNASEPKTLQQAMERLNGARATVIMDAGIATRANVASLRSKGLDWICVQRTQAPPPLNVRRRSAGIHKAGSPSKPGARAVRHS